MTEQTLYHKCERCGGRAGWTEPNTLEWVECEADGCDLGVVPVEPVRIRWCMTHRRETFPSRTTCVGMGGDLLHWCKVVDALLMRAGDDASR